MAYLVESGYVHELTKIISLLQSEYPLSEIPGTRVVQILGFLREGLLEYLCV